MVKLVSLAGFPLLSSKKPGLHGKDSAASCPGGPGEDHSRTQVQGELCTARTTGMSALSRLSERPLLFQIVLSMAKVEVMPVLYTGKSL